MSHFLELAQTLLLCAIGLHIWRTSRPIQPPAPSREEGTP